MNSVSQIVLPAALGLFCATAALAQNAPPAAGQHSQSTATSGPNGSQSAATSESNTSGATSESRSGVTAQPTVEPHTTGTVNQSATSNQRTSSQRTGQANYSQTEPMSHDTVMAVQRRLQQDGLYHGTVDGQWGPATQTSLSDFQRRNNMTANGELDQHTLNALNLNGTSNSTSNDASNVQQSQSQSHSSSSSKTE